MTSIAHNPPSWARAARPANVAATSSAAPQQYDAIAEEHTPGVYTHRSHAAQYGAGRRWGFSVRALVLHTTETGAFSNTLTADMYRKQTVSATAYCGPDGSLALTIPGNNRPWTTGRWNDETESLEIIGYASMTAAEWRERPQQLEGIVRWIVARCQAHNLPAVWLTADQFAEGASRQSTQPYRMGTRRGVTDHYTANQAAIKLGGSPATYSHHDIGDGLREVVIDDLMPEVARRIAGTPTPPPTEEPEMLPVIRPDGYADQFMLVPIDNPQARRKMGITDDQTPVIVQVDRAALEAQLSYKLSPMG